MIGKLVVLFAVIVLAYGDKPPAGYGAPPPPPSYGAPPPPPPPPPPTPYAYNYAVLDAESGNDFSAEEEGDEHGKVIGQYKVLRADGIIMTVTYTVEGDSGFVADIATEAAPPAPPSYGAPPPAALPSYV